MREKRRRLGAEPNSPVDLVDLVRATLPHLQAPGAGVGLELEVALRNPDETASVRKSVKWRPLGWLSECSLGHGFQTQL